MKIRVLGSYGSRLPGFGTASFLIDERLLLDAGSIVWKLSLDEQLAVDNVLLTHAHLDHMVDLAFFAENICGRRSTPVRVWAPGEVLEGLRRFLFNEKVWPDFTRLPTAEVPTLELHPLPEGAAAVVAGLRVRWARTTHPVFAVGYLLEDANAAVLFSGDTGPTEAIWALGRTCEELRAVFAEASFPNSCTQLADKSGHLTPDQLDRELEKLGRPAAEVKLYHMKPAYLEELQRDIAALGRDLQVLHGDEVFHYSV